MFVQQRLLGVERHLHGGEGSGQQARRVSTRAYQMLRRALSTSGSCAATVARCPRPAVLNVNRYFGTRPA